MSKSQTSLEISIIDTGEDEQRSGKCAIIGVVQK